MRHRARSPVVLLLVVVGSVGRGLADAPPAKYGDGAAAFQQNCAVCHRSDGTGQAGLAPPLTSNPARYAASVQGREQLADTVLYGMFGEVTVLGQHYNFKMPEFAQLDDALLAATLNFLVFDLGHASSDTPAITAGDVATARKTPLSGADVRERRARLVESLGL